MTFTHTITDSYQTGAGVIASTPVQYTGQTEVGFDTTLAIGTTNQFVNLTWLHANVQSMLLYTTGGGISIKTNNLTLTGNTHTTTTIDGLSSVAGLAVGQAISGAGIPAGATIATVNVAGSSITISAPATSTGTAVPLTVGATAAALTATQDTVAVAAGQNINWGSDHTEAIPVPHDVVAGFFITNSSGTAAAIVKIRVLVNP